MTMFEGEKNREELPSKKKHLELEAFFLFPVIKTQLATSSLRNPEATCCLDEGTKNAISCSTRER
jgi:hypothetical protein